MILQLFEWMVATIGQWPSVVLFFLVGIAGLNYGADWLVDGASNIGFRFGISAAMIGLTVVAFGTSAPELVVSVMTALQGKPEICLGNVVGSNIANTALILGATAIIFPINVSKDAVNYDAPISFFAIATVLALALIGSTISRLDGLILLGIFTTWMIWLVRKSLREASLVRKERKEQAAAKEAARAEGAGEVEEEELHFHPRPMWMDAALITVGLVALVFGADALVIAAVAAARALAVPEVVVGLTIVAGGTSLPELAVGLMAALKRNADITVGNVMGSNIFNGFLILGVAAVLAPIAFNVNGFAWSGDAGTLYVDIPFCVFVCALVIPMMRHNQQISRAKGGVLLLLYLGYLVTLVLRQ
ncbi:calcium/sodium antiporter [Acanthopleuribacter pedis]|uniref:Calcium/sodium antiporter n=1 Tax=Acanthopleuribacter pedis TaxID=442870 RepID=A0A8J7QBV9_9BACT|nr:calcium/sodium antiporter [Acanthopleuribacter pedis]MBO1321597.1 calcium/sodium antiporter [Acanthopleuribacter pedis]